MSFSSPVFLFMGGFKPKIRDKKLYTQNAQQRTRRPTLLTIKISIPDAASVATRPPPGDEAQEGKQDNGGDYYECQGRRVGGGYQGGIFD